MPHVLIVEDDADVREMLEYFFASNGYSTDAAANGREALQCAADHRPCVILLDLMMPVMSGWEFRERQLERPELAAVPVVCVTAVHDRKTVAERLRVRCLSKPVDFGELMATVSEHCGPGATP